MKAFKYLVIAFALVGLGMFALGKFVQWRMTPEQLEAHEKRMHEEALEANRIAALSNEEWRRRHAEITAAQHPFLDDLVKLDGVQSAEFVGHDVLRVRFAPLVHIGEHHVRVMCEGIARMWAERAGLGYVRCESWYGNERYASGKYQGQVPAEYHARLAAEKLEKERPAREKTEREANAAMTGKTMAEVEATHGPAQARDPITGWAEWPKFKARFRDGKVFDVEVR